MGQEKIVNMIQIPEQAKIKVYWSDYPENYSRESRNRVKKYFSIKYNIPSENINVTYKPIKRNQNGDIIEISGANIENIMSIQYQRELFKEWLTREGKTDVDFDRLLSLDDKVNNEMEIDINENSHKKYKLKWITINNFLSYGENNHFPVSDFKGFTVVNSLPANTGGKTTLTIDSVKFLFFGKTTKTETNEQVFNQFSDANELTVKGAIEIDGGEELIIERKLERKAKRNGGWNITNKLNYYKILPDGEEEILNDEDAIKTTKLIKEIVGEESDFDLVVLATSRNLDSLVDSTAGESGKLLTKFIGLEPIAIKERIVRDMYNTFSKSMKSNIYDVETLKEEIKQHNEVLITLNETQKSLNDDLISENNNYKKLSEEKLSKVESKDKIDSTIFTLNPSKLEEEIEIIVNTGLKHKSDIELIDEELKNIGKVDFDEDTDFKLNKEKQEILSEVAVTDSEINRLKNVIKELINGGICQACNRKLDNVDNTEHIDMHNKTIENLINSINIRKRRLDVVIEEINKLSTVKAQIEKKNKLELNRDRFSVEIESLRNKIKDKKSDLKKYNDNIESIEKNKNIDADISLINTKLSVSENAKNKINSELQNLAINIDSNSKDILKKENLIKNINGEREIEKIFKLYIDMVGKKGISKLVLRSVLPIINSELQRLLEDITDFEVEVYIDDKNEVRYLLVKDGIEKSLKSGSGFELTTASIALRCVLGKMSTLPSPNFITFDEVLGRVAPENIPNIKPLFERISDMFDIVFFITQNEVVKDWAKNIITINKVNNISRLNVKGY